MRWLIIAAALSVLQFTVPLTGFAPGQYECQVSVLDPAGAKATFWRAPIVIIP